MVIDCHGHYTTAPRELELFRERQIAGQKDSFRSHAAPSISDDQIRESLENAQLKLQRERGTDLTIFSPRASAMGHHIGDAAISLQWSMVCNDLIHRVCALYPENFIGGKPVATQISRSASGRLHRRVGALRQGIGLCGLQSESGPLRRPLDRPAADRPLVVPALRENGGA